jgi:phenylalanyl-tRNA synthetase alpha chain
MDLDQTFAAFQQQAMTAIAAASNSESLEQVRIEFLGKKQGKLKDLQATLGKVPPEQRPEVGKRFNEVKDAVTKAWEERQQLVSRPKLAATAIDVTLPGVRPEIEDERHNFVALNIPDDHPARDPLDNFYLATASVAGGGPRLLRSQTSTIQIRVMENRKPPVRIVSVGRVYRPDEIDDTHHIMFHQMEGLMVGPDVTMASLKTVLRLFAAAYLGEDVHVRFRPSFFPFTEPSVEFDVRRGDSWLELGGAGMVDPNVLRAVGYDPDEVSGFAFGLGIARFCMMRHGIKNIRHFYSNDLRFLQQF